jgi:hypothetical protein
VNFKNMLKDVSVRGLKFNFAVAMETVNNPLGPPPI